MQKQSPKVSRRSLTWQLLGVVLILGIWWGTSRSQKPEVLPVDAAQFQESNIVVHQSNVYWAASIGDHQQILALPVTGGKPHTFVEASTNREISAYPGGLVFTDTGLLYMERAPVPNPMIDRANMGFIPSSKMVYLGSFLSSAPSLLPGEQRHPMPEAAQFPRMPYQVLSVPLQGGKPHFLPGVETLSELQVVGDTLYWIKPRPDEKSRVTLNKTWWDETKGRSDLMATSLKTEETRRLATGLTRDAPLYALPGGVYWVEPRPYPDKGQILYWLPTGASQPKALPDFLHTMDRSATECHPVEYRGRLYWFFSISPPGFFDAYDRLLSANPDGSDVRTVLDFAATKKRALGSLHVYRNGLYYTVQSLPNTTKRDASQGSISLCRLDPERAVSREILPLSSFYFYLEDNYVYFVQENPQRSLWEIVTFDDTHKKYVSYLCRYRLSRE